MIKRAKKTILDSIEGLAVKELTVHTDDRGYLYEIAHAYDLPKFGQVYAVGNSARDAIRAFHKHDILWDLFCVVKGSAKFVFVDDRKGSATKGYMQIMVTSDRSLKLIIVPPGVYHGWMSLEDDTLMISTASELYNREKPDEYRIDSFTYGDVWTIKGR
jgi:dTDP-4-dehydrorhamnose 3,5-epimerase-like enzyme